MESRFGNTLAAVGHGMLRYGLVVILLLFGAMKWTTQEAEAIRAWVSSSPFLSWLYSVTTVQGASDVIGCVEVAAAVLMAVRRWSPRASAIGGALATGTFVVTLSFLFTTPGQGGDAQGFLLKDFFLLGAAVWSTGESLAAVQMEGRTFRSGRVPGAEAPGLHPPRSVFGR
jgi:uncharacterized membrane protein YkgB